MLFIGVLQRGPSWCPMCGSMGPWGWWGMILFWLAVVAVIAGALWLVLQAAQRRGDVQPPMENAEEILRQRFARGEIDREAFVRMLDDLKREPSSRTS